jgi:hypothetical protein
MCAEMQYRRTTMKTFLALTSLALLSLPAVAAPTLADKPPKWEYAELTFRSTAGRPARVDPDGVPMATVQATTTIRWITNDGEIDAKGWDELADMLKMKGFKKEGSAALQKVRMLNILGSEGWELMEQQGGNTATTFGPGDRSSKSSGFGSTGTTTWLLKRRIP